MMPSLINFKSSLILHYGHTQYHQNGHLCIGNGQKVIFDGRIDYIREKDSSFGVFRWRRLGNALERRTTLAMPVTKYEWKTDLDCDGNSLDSVMRTLSQHTSIHLATFQLVVY